MAWAAEAALAWADRAAAHASTGVDSTGVDCWVSFGVGC